MVCIYVSCIIAPKGCSAACISVLPNGHMRNTPSNCRAVAGFDASVSCVIKKSHKQMRRCVPDYPSGFS
ncbi:Large ribosomal subunit protein [Trichinella spiralis]|uniref:Large ribosomal subunit protein n=1 Tax=Trichinella spiralis TaxID=6334 RepID=A0ABR3K4E1_TRISP